MLFQESQNASRLSEHPPVRGEKMSKRLGGIIGCRHKTSSWHLNGFPYGSNIRLTDSIMSGRSPPLLYTYINRHAGTPEKQQKQQKHSSTSSNMVLVIIYCYIGCKTKPLHGI